MNASTFRMDHYFMSEDAAYSILFVGPKNITDADLSAGSAILNSLEIILSRKSELQKKIDIGSVTDQG